MDIPSLKNIKTAYFIGIKGVGMTALAQILQSRGVRVDGSDTQEKFFTDEVLKKLQIEFIEKFSVDNIPSNVDLFITSVAYLNKQNPELEHVKKLGLPLITYPQALAELFNSSYGIAVAGSHGKSTTTAMLGVLLEQAGYDPTVIVGTCVNQWGSNARAGHSNFFVVEADEYMDAFLQYEPKIVVVTNIDYDHPDYFKTKEQYKESFQKFTTQPSVQTTVMGLDDRIDVNFNLKVSGEYNQKNAYLAYRVALQLGISPEIAKKALENFEGTARRFEYYGNYKGAELYDDYAHHPTEIEAVIRNVKQKFLDKKIIVLFQPHTYSRTESLFSNFVSVLSKVQEVYVLKSYASVRESGEDISGKRLAQALNAVYFDSFDDATNFLKNKLGSNNIFLALGAGNQWRVLEGILS